jgi:hypothetical protein
MDPPIGSKLVPAILAVRIDIPAILAVRIDIPQPQVGLLPPGYMNLVFHLVAA